MNIIEMEIKGKLMETNMVDSYTSNLHIGKNINVNIVIVMKVNEINIMCHLLASMHIQ